jgi:hypothetical protein
MGASPSLLSPLLPVNTPLRTTHVEIDLLIYKMDPGQEVHEHFSNQGRMHTSNAQTKYQIQTPMTRTSRSRSIFFAIDIAMDLVINEGSRSSLALSYGNRNNEEQSHVELSIVHSTTIHMKYTVRSAVPLDRT